MIDNLDSRLTTIRGQFPILACTNYLISNSLGAMPANVGPTLDQFVQTWAARGVRAWEEGWWTLAADLGDLVAPLIGAKPGTVVFQPSVTIAHSIVLSALSFASRPRVVTDAMHFPSILYLLDGLKRQGAEIIVVPSDDGITIDRDRLLDQIDGRTALVCISHVLFKSAFIHDVASIAAKARKVGAMTIVDGYQAVGTLPVDVDMLGVDVYIGGCLKWLCGGPGAAFLWVAPDVCSELEPALTGWMSHSRPFAFEPVLDRRSDVWRFLVGTPAIASSMAARPGLAIIGEIGIDAIRQKSISQTSLLIELALAEGWKVTTPRDASQRGGTVAITVEHGLEVSRALKSRQVLCDFRPGAGVRLSPHFYTDDNELHAAIGAIKDIMDTGAWKSFSTSDSVVT